MTKLTIEIKDDKFIYEYEVGENRHSSTMNISADSLAVFGDLLRLCSSHSRQQFKDWERKALERAYIESKKEQP